MITWSFVVERIKDELSLPFQMIEFDDQEIIKYLKMHALKKFTFYFPQKWRLSLNCSDPSIQVPARRSEYYLIDPDDRDILTIVDFIPNMGTHLMNNHPFMGPFTTGSVPEHLLQVYNSNLLKPFSNFNYMTEFIPPNMIRITPRYQGQCVIEYERTHDPELSTLNPELEDHFINLCIGMFFMKVGRIRLKYSTTQTPFGEIPLNGDTLMNDGKEIFDRTIEQFERLTVPNIVFHSG